MRDVILETISMQDIIDKYNIPNRNGKVSCPFHGIDRHPSAKIYETNFHCFTCSKHLDVIGFVEDFFNLSFKDAMQKINIDFGLGLDNTYIDYEKLKKLKNIENEKKRKKQELIKKYCELCDAKHSYEKIIDYFSKKINVKNWETMTEIVSNFKMKVYLIEEELEKIDNLLSSRT